MMQQIYLIQPYIQGVKNVLHVLRIGSVPVLSVSISQHTSLPQSGPIELNTIHHGHKNWAQNCLSFQCPENLVWNDFVIYIGPILGEQLVLKPVLTLTPVKPTKYHSRKCKNWSKSDYVINKGDTKLLPGQHHRRGLVWVFKGLVSERSWVPFQGESPLLMVSVSNEIG